MGKHRLIDTGHTERPLHHHMVEAWLTDLITAEYYFAWVRNDATIRVRREQAKRGRGKH